MKAERYTIEKQSIKLDPIKTDGLILDIGGGGEGIIGRLNGKKVIAIDPRAEELEETKNDSLKIVMDATDLKFLPSSFDIATSFFSLMYIKDDYHLKVFKEVHRVLKDDGRFFIWDVRIPSKSTDKTILFIVPLEIFLPGEKIETGYGTPWDPRGQDLEYFKRLASQTGFKIVDEWSRDEIFYLEVMKHAPSTSPNSVFAACPLGSPNLLLVPPCHVLTWNI
jgi:ubiquinone/menaquinone biosynthesis C-methylase UbiE